jgi:muramoyltetrapeptide carboxypeptidase LdcA involved in peptidoglycan recycling
VPDTTYQLTEPTLWRALDGAAELQFSGRLIGGCLDTLMHTAGTVHGDVRAFISACGSDGAVLYLENSGLTPTDWVRALHRLRWAGWLDGLAGVLIGRSAAPDTTGATQLRYADALQSTLGALPAPVLWDVDIGHRPPQLVLLNGALAQVRWRSGGGGSVAQQLV